MFGNLPEMILNTIFDFATDGPIKLAFDAKQGKFVNRPNNNFELLNKALKFKIENPPEYDRDDPLDLDDEDLDLMDIDEDITEMLIFKYPLKLRLRKDCDDSFHVDEGHLSVTFYYRKDFYTNITKKCSISIPEYYRSLRVKAYNHYSEQMIKHKRLSGKKIHKLTNMIKGFRTESYAEDVEFI